jgi:hypothetical protein
MRKHDPKPNRLSSTARGYDTQHRKDRLTVFNEQSWICGWCKQAWCQDLHHINHDTSNRSRENLIGICRTCHTTYHHGTNSKNES